VVAIEEVPNEAVRLAPEFRFAQQTRAGMLLALLTSWRYGDVAGYAAEVLATMMAREKREAFRNKVEAMVERAARLSQLC
jgi:hypothetical protein